MRPVRTQKADIYLILAGTALALQLSGTVYVCFREVTGTQQTYAETGYVRNPSGAMGWLALALVPLLLSVIAGAFRHQRLGSICLAALALLLNAFFCAFAYESRDAERAASLLSSGILDVHNVEFIHLNYWQWWFFLSSALLIAAIVLGIKQLRSQRQDAPRERVASGSYTV